MQRPLPKFDALSGKRLPERTLLFSPSANQSSNLLTRLAQARGTEAFEKWYCKRFLEPRFKGVGCEDGLPDWASIAENDTLEELTATWIERAELVYSLDQIPVSGQTDLPLWSDDYWRTRWGGVAYRYQEAKSFNYYREAVEDYAQPEDWILTGSLPSFGWAADRVTSWSPAEKYDLSVGDEAFTLTRQQKKDGEKALSSDGNVEAWMGICHGWAAAALLVPKPIRDTTVIGNGGLKVKWTAHDVRAMVSLAWANGSFESNYAGARCRVRGPQTYPNGRIMDQDCFDSNPATFHLALGNLIGRRKQSFIIDNTYDYEIWNQPLHSYEFIYFNPLNTAQRSANWRDVAVDYDSRFKAKDRFQFPNTRGLRSVPSGDGKIRKIVGVIASVVYLAEVFPRGAEVLDNSLGRVVLLYDLELEAKNGSYVPSGGEWHQSPHPDFLWLPRRGQIASAKLDGRGPAFSGSKAPDPSFAASAREASATGYPLCRVLKALLKGSSENSQYECPRPAP